MTERGPRTFAIKETRMEDMARFTLTVSGLPYDPI